MEIFYAGSQIRAVQIRAMRNRASRGMTVHLLLILNTMISRWIVYWKMLIWILNLISNIPQVNHLMNLFIKLWINFSRKKFTWMKDTLIQLTAAVFLKQNNKMESRQWRRGKDFNFRKNFFLNPHSIYVRHIEEKD